MAYILFYVKKGSSPWFASLMAANKVKYTSPISVLDRMGGIPSPSSAEETSTSSFRETPEKEPDPCTDVSPEAATNHNEADNSPSTSYAYDNVSHQKELHCSETSRSPARHKKRSNSGQFVLNLDDVFHDEQLGKTTQS